jgi:dihydrofolate reductase
MTLNIISALTENRVIGIDNDLPWNLPDDWKRLNTMIKDKNLVMGRKTFESNKSFISNKIIYIFSKKDDLELPNNCIQVRDVVSFMNEAEGDIFVLGGGEIYNLLLPHCNRLHLTLIQTELKGDTRFPVYDDSNWILETSIYHPADDNHAYPFYFNSYIQRIKN